MDLLIPAFSGVFALVLTLLATPKLIVKMRTKGMVGIDVNKIDRRSIPEMGGIGVVMAFVIAISISVWIGKTSGDIATSVVLAVIGVTFISSFIGLVDDVSVLSQKIKAILVGFAALPLILVHPVTSTIAFPFGFSITFPFHLYWFIIVPFAITGAANALNMSAGYNGLETGEVIIMSAFLLVISFIKGSDFSTYLVFFSLLGSSLGFYYFNKYPAKIFVGDIGTLSMGAIIGAGVVIGKIEFYGVIVILPAFFELLSTIYHNLKHIDRKSACRNPIILEDGKIKTPDKAKWFTLAYFILSRRPMKENELVNRILALYAICGFIALFLALL